MRYAGSGLEIGGVGLWKVLGALESSAGYRVVSSPCFFLFFSFSFFFLLVFLFLSCLFLISLFAIMVRVFIIVAVVFVIVEAVVTTNTTTVTATTSCCYLLPATVRVAWLLSFFTLFYYSTSHFSIISHPLHPICPTPLLLPASPDAVP